LPESSDLGEPGYRRPHGALVPTLAILLSVLAGYDPDDPATGAVEIALAPLDYGNFSTETASKACELG